MSLSKVHVAAEGCIDISGSCCRQKPCESPCSIPPLTEKGKETSFAVVVMTADSQLRTRDMGFCDNLPTPCHPHPKKKKEKEKKETIKENC